MMWIAVHLAFAALPFVLTAALYSRKRRFPAGEGDARARDAKARKFYAQLLLVLLLLYHYAYTNGHPSGFGVLLSTGACAALFSSRYVSTHPMFGPTFANLGNLQTENAIIIKESDHMGKIFFKDLYGSLKLNVCEYTFEGHDEVVAYSLSVPFASTLVFASIMKHQDAPGTTFKKHMAIARGLLSEDDYLLTEILFNPKTPAQIDNIVATLTRLSKIIDKKDSGEMKRFLDGVRKNLE